MPPNKLDLTCTSGGEDSRPHQALTGPLCSHTVYWFPRAAVTNCHRLSGIKTVDIYSLSFGGQKREIQVLAGLVPGEGSKGETTLCLSPSFRCLPAILGVSRLVGAALQSLPRPSPWHSPLCLCKIPSSYEESDHRIRTHPNLA